MRAALPTEATGKPQTVLALARHLKLANSTASRRLRWLREVLLQPE